MQTGSLQTSSHVSSISWNLEGSRLLTGGVSIQLWHERVVRRDDEEQQPVTFEIGGDVRTPPPGGYEDQSEMGWECIWKCNTATPVHHMAFSPDGTLFATSGKSDRLVKVWFENKHLLFPTKSFDATHYNSLLHHQASSQYGGGTHPPSELNYGFVYVAHPRAVTHISWRKTSKYMPKGSVSNMLVTSCLDNICRIWVETVLPDDGLVNMNQFDPLASQNPKFRTHRHKHRFMQRLKHMKTCFHIRRHAKGHGGAGGAFGVVGSGLNGMPTSYSTPGGGAPIPSLPSTYSVHDFHSYGYHGTGVTPGLHFHLAASINGETDIPLVPSMQSSDPASQPNFILHWLNNKEMHFSLQAETILQEMTRKVIEKEDQQNMHSNVNSEGQSEAHEHDSNEEAATAAMPTSNTNPFFNGSSTLDRKKLSKQAKSFSHDENSQSDEHQTHSMRSGVPGAGAAHSMSNTTSLNSIGTDPQVLHVSDSLDMKIECLLRDWHHNPDLLFSIHPIDGSFLIWVIEWLDEYHPGSFRQAQVSFSTRIPYAFPLGDAMSMSTTVSLYNTGCNLLHLRDMVKGVKPTTAEAGNGAGKTSGGEEKDGTSLPSVIEEQETDQTKDEAGAGGDDDDGGEKKQNNEDENDEENTTGKAAKSNNEESENLSAHTVDIGVAPPVPTVSMVTKHSNGTLNLWQLTFADKTKFTSVLNIGHASRASGHRFRVNDITCHPVLPLLLTTSHHNIPDVPSPLGKSSSSSFRGGAGQPKDVCFPSGFCSELILWRVDAVGPLSQSGGVSELARINSPEISAFSNVAWIPTLLPSTTLGNLSNSPSACFVASDGECLRVYQAVIDARTLLAEISTSERRDRRKGSTITLSTDCSSDNGIQLHNLSEKIKIVSQQSTARPGCVIQLDTIDDATHDWTDTQFLHVFQEQLITGERNIAYGGGMDESNIGLMSGQMGAMVDLQRNADFEEPFYIVILERTTNGSTLHMWRLVIASQPPATEMTESMMYVPDSNLVQDLDDTELGGGPRASMSANNVGADPNEARDIPSQPHVSISTTKVCTQDLPLPDGVDVVHASPAAGHLSSSSIYPACFAPYIIVTACSDSTTRFWKCKVTKDEINQRLRYEWCEWEMLSRDKESLIEVNGQPLNISAAYSGRIACAYKYGKSFTRPHKGDPDSRYVNLCVAIYECESSGGSEWILEDTIHLKNIHLPRIQLDPHLDLSYLHDNRFLQKKHRITQVLQTLTTHDEPRSLSRNGDVTPDGLTKPASSLLAVPSFSTLQSLRKSITENGNTCPLTQKHLVQLDWVSKEDGSHILTVAVGSKIMLYTPVSSDLAQANMKAMKESQSTNRPLLRKASSLAQPHFNDEIRWMKLRHIELETADGLPPLPMQISWVRDGILVVGMDSEMHVYSQWKTQKAHHLLDIEDLYDNRNLRDEDLRSLANENSQRRLANVPSMPHMSRVSSMNLQMLANEKKKKLVSPASQAPITGGGGGGNGEGGILQEYMPDYGLFEAARIACPVLPQYHPKQLMELLNSGKIRWVKAILAHLVRCISGTYVRTSNSNNNDDDSSQKQVRSLCSVEMSCICCPLMIYLSTPII